MNCHLYLRKDTLYLPTMGKMAEGFLRGVEPVIAVSVSNADAMRQALQATILRGNPLVPMLRRSEIPPPVLLKYAGVRSWSAFERGMSFWTIEDDGTSFRIAGQKKQPNRMWNDDPAQIVTFAPGSNVDQVIDRMIAILQDAARQ
jgi:hypothetical protein